MALSVQRELDKECIDRGEVAYVAVMAVKATTEPMTAVVIATLIKYTSIAALTGILFSDRRRK